MGTARVLSATVVGIDGVPVAVESDVSQGLPAFALVGLPDTAVRESRDRVRAAIHNCGVNFPPTRVTVNLAPADLKKEGPAFDLPVACAIMLASGRIEFERGDGTIGDTREVAPLDERTLILGELGLDGTVRPIIGILPIALAARRLGFTDLILPEANAAEASVVGALTIRPVTHLRDVIPHLLGQGTIAPYEDRRGTAAPLSNAEPLAVHDLAYVHGLGVAKRALEVAAAGGHNLLFVGPPGSGKSLLARCLPAILPALAPDEQLQVTMVHSVAGALPPGSGLVTERPYRSPHHSASDVALIGGGTNPRPGEVSLAHRGVLFLDEFPEFGRSVLEGLRQPLEDGVVTVSRAAGTVTFPARFQLIAAMNPCPCGFWRDEHRQCVCPPGSILKYQRRVSGPLLDRIDIVVDVPRLPSEELLKEPTGERSSKIRVRVTAAWERQRARAAQHGIAPSNAELQIPQLRKFAGLTDAAQRTLIAAAERFHLSSRATIRSLRVARTIADLVGSDTIEGTHMSEALQYRPKFQMTT